MIVQEERNEPFIALPDAVPSDAGLKWSADYLYAIVGLSITVQG